MSNFRIVFCLLILCTFFVLSCKNSLEGPNEVKENVPHYGAKVFMVSKCGELFENQAFLPLPLNHARLINQGGDTLDVVILAKPIDGDSTYVFPYGYFEVKENEKKARPFVFALPEDKTQMIMARQAFQDFMLNNYPIKQIIDAWFSNFKGQSKTRVQNWKETYYAEDKVNEFLKIDITNTARDSSIDN